MNKLQQAMADRLMAVQINGYVNKLIKKGVEPTSDLVLQGIDAKSLDILLAYGYTIDKIKNMAEKAITKAIGGRQNDNKIGMSL